MFRKTLSGILLMLLIFSTSMLAFNIQPVKAESRTWIVDDDGPADFHTIQKAINAASDGDTVHIYNGTYLEHIVVNMSISLIGEDRSATIIDGNGTGTVMHVIANNTVISGFTIRKSGEKFDEEPALWCGLMVGGYEMPVANTTITNNYVKKNFIGVFLWFSINSTLVDNDIENNTWGVGLVNCIWNNIKHNTISNNGVGIVMDFASQNDIDGNNITSNKPVGLIIDDSSLNKIHRNHIEGNEYGIDISESDNNKITDNTVRNSGLGISLAASTSNIFYHNDFLNNTKQVDSTSEYANVWDDGAEGNYWSNHNPPDEDKDKIGDTPYVIDENNTDRHPLIYPYGYKPKPDVNDDGVVDIKDLYTIARTFGTKPGDDRWNPIADIDTQIAAELDEIINIKDIYQIAKNFGKEWKDP